MRFFEHPQALSGIHYLLYAYNGLVVLLLAGFMSLTQWKINRSMTARSFLDSLSAVPWPATYIFCSAVLAFGGLFLLSWLGEELIVDVRDDGAGFDPASAVRGRGLNSMTERLQAAGGRLIIESIPQEGTTVAAVVPR